MDNFYSPYFTIEKMAVGIFAAIVKEGAGAWGNAGIIDLGDATVVIDTFLTPAAEAGLREAAEKLTDSPLKYVINTHWHFDHCFGNQVFNDIPIISSCSTRDSIRTNLYPLNVEETKAELESHFLDLQKEMNETEDETVAEGLKYEIIEKQHMYSALDEISVTLPSITFEQKLHLNGTKRSLVIQTFGGGHSGCDSFVYVEEEGILFSGDLVFVNTHPSIHSQDPKDWIAILDKMLKLGIKTVIPGHGTIGSRKDMLETRKYLEDIGKRIDRLKVEKAPINAETVKIPSTYADWKFAHVYGWNLKALYDKSGKVQV